MKKPFPAILLFFSIILLGLLLTPQPVSAQSVDEPGLIVLSAKEDLHVLVFAHDFPPFLEIQVSLRPLAASDENSVDITTVNTKETGTFFKVLYIPPALVGEGQIEIKLEGIKNNYAAVGSFSNETFDDNQAAESAREILRLAEVTAEEALPSVEEDVIVVKEAAVEETLPPAEEAVINVEPEPVPVPTTEEIASEWLQSGSADIEWEDPVPFVWPAEKRWLSGYNFTAAHPGIDIAASADDLIFAAASGKVIRVNHSNVWYGNMVMIEHLNGYQTLYAHLNTILVEVGSYVFQGQPIGLAGSTGNSTGVHLHFEIRYQNEFINPWLFFDN